MAGLLLDVDASDFVTASSSATTAASTAETAAATLRSALSSSSQMAGSDQNGVKWAGQYDKVAADAVRGLNTVITMLGGVSTGLAVSGANYATADWLSAGHTGTAPGHTIPPLPAMVCSAAPPSASGGSRHSDIPGFDLVANFIGDLWPDGDTGKLRSTKTAWDALADSLSTLHSTGITKVSSALEGSQTPEMPAIHSTITTVSTAISNLATEARTIGKACGDFADQIDTVHQQTEKELQSLLDQIAATAALSIGLTIFTAGLSDAAGAAAAATETGIAVSRILSFIAELGTTVARTIDEIATVAGSLAKVAGISETITIRVVTIAGKSVVTGLGGAASNVAVTEITDPGANISDAALTGFIAGAGFSALGDGTKMAFAAKDARALYNSTTAGKMALAEKTLARSAKTFTDNATAARWGARVWNKEAQALPKENRAALFDYTSDPPHNPSYVEFNNSLRGLTAGSKQITHEVDLIDQSLLVKPVPHDVMVARGTNLNHVPEGARRMVGREYSDDAFMSTSLGQAAFQNKDAVLHLKVPKGTPAMYLEKVSAFAGSERELLLGRGLTYRVNDAIFDDSTKTWQLYAEVVSK